MARRRRSTTTRAITLARAPAAPRSAPQQIVIRPPAAPAAPRRATRRRAITRRSSSSAPRSSGSLPSLAATAAAGGVIGLLKSSGLLEKIPRLPVIGRIGALAVGAHYLAQYTGSQLARDVSRAATTLAAYQLATSDKAWSERIDGDSDDAIVTE